MKKITSLLLLTVCTLVSYRASADLVAEWDFNSYSGGNENNAIADVGPQGSISQGGTGTAKMGDASGANGTSFNPGATPDAGDMSIPAGNAFGTSATQDSFHPNSYSFTVSGTGLSGFVVTYDTQQPTGTLGSTALQQWSYFATGGSETAYGSVYASSASYGLKTIDFSGVTALNNATSVTFYLDVGSPSDGANSWSVDFDNFAISTVPEPVNTALACFGLGIAVVSLGRFHVSRRRRIS